MPNGYDTTKEYGGHNYGENTQGTVDCKFGCGCSAGPTRSNGPLGLDPLGGECPNNPKSGQRLPGDGDYRVVVTRRIRGLEKAVNELRRRAEKAEARIGKKLSEALDLLETSQQRVDELEKKIRKVGDYAFASLAG